MQTATAGNIDGALFGSIDAIICRKLKEVMNKYLEKPSNIPQTSEAIEDERLHEELRLHDQLSSSDEYGVRGFLVSA